jgi:hypothetical protein
MTRWLWNFILQNAMAGWLGKIASHERRAANGSVVSSMDISK